LLSIFESPHKKNSEENQKYIAVKGGHKAAQKIVKYWLRKFKNTKIEI